MKEIASPTRSPHIDDVIVELHEQGENLFQASARAALVEGTIAYFPALLAEIADTGRVLLASGDTTELPRLDAAGVAEICSFELGCTDYDADRVVVEEPMAAAPRVPATDLLPALRDNGYAIAGEGASWNHDHTPLSRLAEATGLNYPLLHRITAGKQKTVAVESAVKILMHLGYDEQAREFEDIQLDDESRRPRYRHEELEFEYLEALTRFAQQARWQRGLMPNERQALDDILWLYVDAKRKTFVGTTPGARLAETMESFREEHGRDPVRLTRRLRDQARRMRDAESRRASERAHQLRRGLQQREGTITASMVTMRTHRLRQCGRLPRKSKPKAYKPDA